MKFVGYLVFFAGMIAGGLSPALANGNEGLVAIPAASTQAPADAAPVPKSAKIAVLGDSLADGIWGGLYRKFVREKRYTIYRGAKNSVGFGGEDLLDAVEKAFAGTPADAVVMMIGANDRRAVYASDKMEAAYGSPQWPDAYRRRVERFMDAVANRNVPLVWILLPIMREDDASRDAKLINEIVIAAAASRPTVALVETWPMMVDGQGAYAAYLKDAKGQSRLMRHTDGVHFSDLAYELIADAAYAKLLDLSTPLRLMATQNQK